MHTAHATETDEGELHRSRHGSDPRCERSNDSVSRTGTITYPCSMGGRWARALPIVLLATSLAVTSPRVAHAETSTQCAAGTDTAALNNFIANEVADLVGFDTARVIAMPDGRYLWTVQDAFISATPRIAIELAAAADRLRPQRSRGARRELLHDLARARDPRRALRCRRRVVRRRSDDGNVQPLVLADEWRCGSQWAARHLLRRDGQRSRLRRGPGRASPRGVAGSIRRRDVGPRLLRPGTCRNQWCRVRNCGRIRRLVQLPVRLVV